MDSFRVETDAAAFRALARAAATEADSVTRVPVEVRVDVEDPWTAYRRVRTDDDEWGVFLETTGEDGSTASGDDADEDEGGAGSIGDRPASGADESDDAGWNYFAVEPVETLTASAEAVPLAADDPDQAGSVSPSLAALEGVMDGTTLFRGDCDVPYPCGAFGWLSYDLARELESLPEHTRDERALPQLQVGLYDQVAAWRTRDAAAPGPTTLRITVCPDVTANAPTQAAGDGADSVDGTTDAHDVTADAHDVTADAHDGTADAHDGTADAHDGTADALDRAYDRAVERARALAERATTGDPSHGPAPVADDRTATFESDSGRAAYADRVRRVQAYVRDGDTFQANISHRLRAPAAVHPVAAYDALRRVNPAPYSGLVECPGLDLVSASPELLLERDGEFVRTEPIAGTRPRGATDAEDQAYERELLTDEKERAEHAMLVDLERNDLGKVCAYGSVDVAEYRRVDRYSEVMHLVSDVTGHLREDVGLADAIGAVFPGGTITGAPKPRTMAIIDELESTRRGPYTGAMAALGFDDRATLNIVIRTLTRYQDEYHLRVGAGIVHDSDPEREYDETLDKARALLAAVDDALDSTASIDVEVPDP